MNPKDLVGAKKAPLGVVPPALMLGAAPAMQVGAEKYGPYNWRGQPVQVMTYLEAILRHVFAFIDGQDAAEDTGISHLGHAAASLGILMDAFAMDNVIDNRPMAGAAPEMLRKQDHSAKPDEGEPKVYLAPRQTVQCSICGVTAPDHSLECPDYRDYRADPDHTVKAIGNEAGEQSMSFMGYPITEAGDGCYVYRGRHIHPLSATPETFAEITRITDFFD